MVPVIVVVPARGICQGLILTQDHRQTRCLPRASALESASRTRHVDHRPGDKQGHCAGHMNAGEVAGRKGEVEAKAETP